MTDPDHDFGTDPLSTTGGGLPYPESSGPLNQGANDIKALALALDSRGLARRFDANTVSVTPNAGGGFVVNFSAPFTGNPVAVLMNTTSGRGGFCPAIAVMAGTITPTGCSGIAANAIGGAPVTENIYVSYLAIGPK